MMTAKKQIPQILRCLYVCVLIVLGAAALWNFPQVRTDLLGLLGTPETATEKALISLSENSSRRVQALIDADDFETAKRGAEVFKTQLPKDLFGEQSGGVPAHEMSELIAGYRAHASGLLSPRERVALQSGETSEIEENAMLLWLSPISGPIPRGADPYGFLTRFLGDLPFSQNGFSLKDGFLTTCKNEKTFVFLSLELREKWTVEAFAAWLADVAALKIDGCKIHLSGAPLHTTGTTQSSTRELNILMISGFGGVVALLLLLFHSLRFLVPVTLSVCVGFWGGIAAVGLLFPEPHILVFVFGTTLIGLAVDYSFHFYLSGGEKITKPLVMAFLTTAASFLVLLLSSFSVLKQLAVFSSVGLAFVLGFVLLFHEKLLRSAPLPATISAAEAFSGTLSRKCATFLKKGGLVAIVIFVIFGFSKVSLKDDVCALYSPSPELVAREQFFLEISGNEQAATFWIVPGENLEAALQAEEVANFSGARLSAFLPSQKRQEENAALVEKFYAASDLAETLGLPTAFAFEKTPPLTPENAPPLLKKLVDTFYFSDGENGYSVIPVPIECCPPAGTFLLTPQEAISELLKSYRAQTVRLLVIALAVLAALLVAVYRKSALRLMIAPVLTIASIVAIFGYCGIALSFVHVLSFFLIIGFGLDYSIFRLKEKQQHLPILLSCITSVMSFGLLFFTSFELTKAMGLTLGMGLVLSLFYSSVLSTGCEEYAKCDQNSDTECPWFTQKEQSAGTLRLEFLWLSYRFFPLFVFKGILFCVCVGIYAAARHIRVASEKYRRILTAAQKRRGLPPARFSGFSHMLEFVFSLVDKIDAGTLKKQRLVFEVRNDENFQKFKQCVQARHGAFLICSHVGNIEILQSLYREHPELSPRTMHAFRDVRQGKIFLEFYNKHCRQADVFIHPIHTISAATPHQMKSAIERGEFVMMAGDRISPGTPTRNVSARILDCDISLPKGVFAFARLMESPIFFVSCVKTAHRKYTFFVKHAPDRNVPAAYARFLETLILNYPKSFFHFYDYFSRP
ncbi:MAG: hypothetical protein IJW12_05560 [Opitutales bacterium]|nr:hypothetical protein [Opitutales bacterium]